MEPAVLFTSLFWLIAIAFVVSLIKPDYRSQKELRNPFSVVNFLGYAFGVIMLVFAGSSILSEFENDPALKYTALTILFLIIFGSFLSYFFLVVKRNWSDEKLFERFWLVRMIYLFFRVLIRIFGRRK